MRAALPPLIPTLDHLVVLFAPDGSTLERGGDVSRKLGTVPTEIFGCFCEREKRQGQNCMRGRLRGTNLCSRGHRGF